MLGDKRLIQSIKLQNFLSFGPDTKEIELKSLNVLIGSNASGKSNLIEARVRGDSDEYSDIDLLLIISQPLHWREEKTVVEMLFDAGME